MSVAPATHGAPRGRGPARRRVRHQVRDGLAVVAFSAAASTALALVVTLLLALAG